MVDSELQNDFANDGDNDSYFVSTQFELKQEEIMEKELQKLQTGQTVSQLLRFRSGISGLTSVTPKPVKVSRPGLRKTGSRKLKKNQSMSAMVKERFKTDKYAYFSGDQRKIDEFLRRLEGSEDIENMAMSTLGKDGSCLFTRDEWICIVQSIKLRFPELSTTKKKSLSAITRQINKQEKENEDENSIWSQARSLPSLELTDEDLKWLYDLDDEQMANRTITSSMTEVDGNDDHSPFVMTLSQTTPSQLSHIKESDSLYSQETNVQTTEPADHQSGHMQRCHSQTAEGKTQSKILEIEIVSDSEEEIESLIRNTEPDSLEDVYGANEVSSHQVPAVDALASFQSFPFAADMIPRNNVRDKEHESLHISSSIRSSPAQSLTQSQVPSLIDSIIEPPCESPRKMSPIRDTQPEPVITSPFKTPTKKSKELLSKYSSPVKNSIHNNMGSPVAMMVPRSSELAKHVEEIIVSSDEESVYSTAKSVFPSAQIVILEVEDEDEEFYEIVSSIPEKHKPTAAAKKRKLLQTSRYEVVSNFNINDYDDDQRGFKLRKLETKPIIIDSDNEIADSEEDEKNLSIIEITREVEAEESEHDTEYLINLGKQVEGNSKMNTSVLQVPSSPSSITFGRTDILKELEAFSNSDLDTDRTINSNTSKNSNAIKSGTNQTIDFTLLSTKELQERFKKWELKPVQGRQRMVLVLSEVSKLFTNSFNDPVPETRQGFEGTVYGSLNRLVGLNQYWHEKIISFEPLRVSELRDWICTKGYELEEDFLMRYCDDNGYCCTRQP